MLLKRKDKGENIYYIGIICLINIPTNTKTYTSKNAYNITS